ncbi:MAG: tRNA uracil 4-sulfurtransferase ThiI [Acidobacteriota bacterium]|jgi:thiamine biosynthesis protein ThiI
MSSSTMASELYLIRLSGEITTKASRTRTRFSKRLVRNLAHGLERAGLEHSIDRRWSRIYVEVDEPPGTGMAGEVIGRTFGIQSYSPVERRPWRDLDDLVRQGHELFREAVAGKSFAVRARRAGDRKRMPFRSKDVERELGAALLPHAREVDLDRPEVTASVEVHQEEAREAYFFREKIPGPAGLPLGTESRALSLVSGGFDSAVASWMMLRRGVSLDYVFFNLGGTVHELGVLRVMKVITEQWSHGDRPRLHSVDFRPLVTEIQERVTPRYWQVVLKRLMLRAAETLARRLRLTALVTGEAIGQVSSQTPQNLAAISRPIELPILRPLLGFNKDEIIDRTRRIGTYELAAAVEEYCAILPKRPATRASIAAVDEEEAKLDPAQLRELVEGRTVHTLRELDPSDFAGEDLEVREIPAGARVVDLRSRAAHDAWHWPDAVHMDFFRALKRYGELDRDATYVFYCEVGLKSAHLAEVMQQAGYAAYHVPGGAKDLMHRAAGGDPLAAQLQSPALLDG